MKINIINTLQDAGCVFAEEETRLLVEAADTLEGLMKMVEQRVNGFPLEYIVGYVMFKGLRIEVDPGVFVPRRRTEFLVRQAEIAACPRDLVVDICCGSGAVGAALAASREGIRLYAVDIDPIAVRCAARNLSHVGGIVNTGDLYEPLPGSLKSCVSIIVANVPYVPTKSIPLLPREARLYEPQLALDGGKDGLDLQRKVAMEAPRWLTSGGHLLIETSEAQATKTVEIVAGAGLSVQVARDEELDATVVIGTKE